MNGIEAYDKWLQTNGKLICDHREVSINNFGICHWKNTDEIISMNYIAYGNWELKESPMSLYEALEKSSNGDIICVKYDGSEEIFNRRNSLISIEDAIQKVWKPVI